MSTPNFILTNTHAFNERAALMTLDEASDPFAMVATSFDAPNLTVVVNRVTFSTNHVMDPSALVSVLMSDT